MIDHVLRRFREWEPLGTKAADDGSRLLAHTPRDYPEAYLHSFFAPVPEAARQSYGLVVPQQLQQFYRECNGLSIFADSLSLWGIRAHYNRGLSAQFQPYDLATHHSECIRSFHRVSAAKPDNRIFFGGYGEDGSSVFVTLGTPHIFRVLRGSSQVVNSWPDLATFLTAEYDRIDRLFDRKGYLLNEDTPTSPRQAA
jgi:hypothetical protein